MVHTSTVPIMGVHIFFWKGEFFRAAQVEKVESLGAAKAKNRGGGGSFQWHIPVLSQNGSNLPPHPPTGVLISQEQSA